MSLSSHTFEYDINLSADKIYAKTLQAIKKLNYKLKDEDKKNKTIIAKTNMEFNYWGQNLTINISNKFISIKAEVNQLMVSKKSKEISESIINEISKSAKLSSSKDKNFKKNNIRLKNSSEHNRSASNDKSNIKKVWWSIGIGFVVLIILSSLFNGGNNSGSNANSQTYSFSSKRVVCTGNGCVIKCSYSGSRLDYWTKFYDDGYHVRLPRWGCPLRLDKNGFPAG